MNISFRSTFIAGIILFVFVSCHERGLVDGGPCSYKINKLPATIIAVQPHDSVSSEILFAVETEGKRDTLYYTRCFVGWATKADIEKYDLRMGNQFVYEEHEIVEGTCSPYFYKLRLEKYK